MKVETQYQKMTPQLWQIVSSLKTHTYSIFLLLLSQYVRLEFNFKATSVQRRGDLSQQHDGNYRCKWNSNVFSSFNVSSVVCRMAAYRCHLISDDIDIQCGRHNIIFALSFFLSSNLSPCSSYTFNVFTTFYQ